MTRQYFSALKKKWIHRHTQAIASRSRDPNVGEQNWLRGVRAAPLGGDSMRRTWTVAQKGRVLAEAAVLSGAPLCAYLKRQGVSLADYERWRLALQDLPANVEPTERVRKCVDEHEHSAENKRGRRYRRARRPSPPAPQSTHEDVHRPGLADNDGSVPNRRQGMRAAGRPRKFSPSIPAHIDQSKLPKGIYWNNTGVGRWFVFVTDPNAGARNTKVVAGKSASLAVLRATVGLPPGDYSRGTVAWVMARFEESTDFAALSASTQSNYRYCAKSARDYKIYNGRGPSLDTLYVDRLRLPVIQGVIETIAKGRGESVPGADDALSPFPTKANHLLRYFHRVFGWGMLHGHCKTNPAAGARQARVRARSGMPSLRAYDAVLKFAQTRGALTPHSAGSLAPYLWPLMEIKYLCRMRSIEVVTLTDAHASERGIYVARGKGSEDNIVRWSRRLRAAWDAAVAARATIRARPLNKARRRPPPERRYIFVTQAATGLSTTSLSTSWRHLMRAAVKAGVITEEQRFTLHGLKHRGVTDTEGSRRRKQLASGHRTEAMVMRYDHNVPVVSPATPEAFEAPKRRQE